MYCLCHLWRLFSDLLLAGWPMHDAFFLQSDESVQRRERDNGIFWYYIEIFRMHNFFSWDQGFFPKTFVFSLDVNILCLPWKGNEIRTSHGIDRGENLYSKWRTGFWYLWNVWDSWYFYWIFGSIDFFLFLWLFGFYSPDRNCRGEGNFRNLDFFQAFQFITTHPQFTILEK